MRRFVETLRWSLLLGLASSLILGCDHTEKAKLSKPVEVGVKKDWLVVSTDPTLMDAARETAKKLKAKALSGFYKILAKSSYLDADAIEMIASHRDDVVSRLNRLAASSMAKNQGIGAALVLLRLKEPSGFARVKEVLRSGTDEQRLRVLTALGWIFAPTQTEEFQSYRQFLVSDSELVELVMKQLDDSKSEIVNAAAQLGGKLKLPGLSDRILAILEKPDHADRDGLVYCLAQGELTEQIFQFAMSPGERARIAADEEWSGSLYEAFARSKNEDWKGPAREILILKLTALPERSKGGYSGWRLNLVSAGRKSLLQWLNKSDRRDAAIDAAAKAYAKSGDTEIVQAIKEVSGSVASRELYSVCHALQSIGGDNAHQVLTSLVPRLEPGQRTFFSRATADVSTDELLTTIEQSGVLPADVMSQAAAKVRQDASKSRSDANTESGESASPFEAHDSGNPPGLLEVLIAANCVHSFDTETGTLPCRHDQLLQDFAKASRGRFVPEAVSEEWLQKKKADDDAPYRVQFIHDGRLYDGELQNLGDWYDVERLTTMINRALEDAELPERFVPLASEGQEATFIFADPARLAPLAAQFHMPLSDDLGEATKRGLEFEQSVKDRLDQAVKEQLGTE